MGKNKNGSVKRMKRKAALESTGVQSGEENAIVKVENCVFGAMDVRMRKDPIVYSPAFLPTTLPPQVLPPPGQAWEIVLPVLDLASPGHFGIRVLRNEGSLSKLMECMMKSPPPSLPGWVVGRMETVAVTKECIWYRGLAIKKMGEQFSVYLLDVGGVVTVVCEQMRPLPKALSVLPAANLQVCLAGVLAVEEKGGGERRWGDAGDMLWDIVNDSNKKWEVEVLGKVTGGRLLVILREMEGNEDAGNLLLQSGQVIPFEDQFESSLVLSHPTFMGGGVGKIGKIVKTRAEVPEGDDIDENVLEIRSRTPSHESKFIEAKEPEKKANFSIGDVVVAKWEEDDVWYNAKVEEVTDEGYLVLFTDYGNSALAKHSLVFKTASEIPTNETIDECVELRAKSEDILVAETSLAPAAVVPGWTRGSVCIVRWTEDEVWYNAVVDSEVDLSGKYQVIFTDYGNTDTVTIDRIVASAANIPKDQLDMIDECVKITTTADVVQSPPTTTLIQDIKNDEAPVTATAKDLTDLKKTSPNCPRWAVGDSCIACWSEDGVWYNAVVESEMDTSGKYQVIFRDYGNGDTVSLDRIFATAEDIPADQLEMIDECVKITTAADGLQSPPISAPNQVVENDKSPVKTSTKDSQDLKKTSHSCKPRWAVGYSCIARWSDDCVWYNAVVESVDTSGEIIVTFTDYGNSATVTRDCIVTTANDIPADQLEMVDECVQLTYNSPPQTAAPLTNIKEEEYSPDSSAGTPEVSPKSITATRQSWKVGDFCVARWSEDGVWYNAEILDLSMTGYLVRFSDYGNEVTVKEEDVVSKGKDIPPEGEVDWLVNLEDTESVIAQADAGQPEDNCRVPPTLACSLCRNVCRRGMRVVCGPAVVCWGCAVKEINTSRSCWMCGEKEITTESHLVKDPVLRAFVDQFVNTGKLDPVHLQALKNGTLQVS
jgi:hypothetical protein